MLPLLRWDIESPDYGENLHIIENLRDKSLQNFIQLINSKKIDGVILSDYNKGFWDNKLAQKIIEYCNKNNIITIIDPKKNLLKWKNCTIFKANSNEIKDLTGLSDWKEQVDFVQEQLSCKGIVITKGGEGIVGKENNQYFEYLTNKPEDVNSVIGAGDVFNVIITMGLLYNLDLYNSCIIGFEAGAKYVKEKHNNPITTNDILARFDKPLSKIVTLEELLYLKNNIYNTEKFVWTNGCFDLGLTKAHVKYLQQAKKEGDKLIVGINSDKSIEKIKGPNRPIVPLDERAYIVASLECVDFIVSYEENTPLELIKKIHPSIIVKGGDYNKEQVVGYDLIDNIIITEKFKSMSTTNKIDKILGEKL